MFVPSSLSCTSPQDRAAEATILSGKARQSRLDAWVGINRRTKVPCSEMAHPLRLPAASRRIRDDTEETCASKEKLHRSGTIRLRRALARAPDPLCAREHDAER